MKSVIISFVLLVFLVSCGSTKESINEEQFIPDKNPIETETNADIEQTLFVTKRVDHNIPFSYVEEIDSYEFITRDYYDEDKIVAESFGYEIDDYFVDIDLDGQKELVCNCQYEVDGHKEVYVFKHNMPGKRGEIIFDESDLPGLNYWGVNAVQTAYIPEKNAFGLFYFDAIKQEDTIKYLYDLKGFYFYDFGRDIVDKLN